MNFDLKEMYRYLISHSLPGLLFLSQMLLFVYSIDKNVIKVILNLNPAIVILSAFGFCTLLGIMLDGLRHFMFDVIIESCGRKCWFERSIGFSKCLYQRFDYLRKENKRIQKANILAMKEHSNNDAMKVHQHFIEFSEEAIWFPYEAYANIVVALLLGLIFLSGVKLLWQFWLLYIIILVALSFEAVLIYKFCSDDQESFIEVYSKGK